MQSDSDWRTYKTSSKHVAEAITKYGISNFQFEILQLFDTRAGVASGEVEPQWQCRVLHAVDEQGERKYWNQAIGNIKFIAKEQLSDTNKLRIGMALKGNTNSLGVKRTSEQRKHLSEVKEGVPTERSKFSKEALFSIFDMISSDVPVVDIANLFDVNTRTINVIKIKGSPYYKDAFEEYISTLLWNKNTYK